MLACARHNHATLPHMADQCRSDRISLNWQPEQDASHALNVQDADLTVDKASSDVLPFHRPADLKDAAAACR